jgi:phytoene dehydrogenase-like protein
MLPSPPIRTKASTSRWDAIVVGTGVAGSVAAALLAETDRRVLVLEAEPILDGFLGATRRDGFRLDRGTPLLSRGETGPLGLVMRRLGLDRPRFLRHAIPARARGMLAFTAPTDRSALPRFGLEVARRLGVPPPDFVRLTELFRRLFGMSEADLRAWDQRPLDELLRAHATHPAAAYLIGLVAGIFFLLPPSDVSAGEAVRCLRWMLRDYQPSYVEGGLDGLGRELYGVVDRRRGEIVAPAKVLHIHRAGGDLEVDTASGDTYRAPIVVCNLAPRELLAIVEEGSFPDEWIARANAVRPSGRARRVTLALERELVDEACLIAVVPSTASPPVGIADLGLPLLGRNVAAIAAGRQPDPLPIFAVVPTSFDPTLAPPGHQTLVAWTYTHAAAAAPGPDDATALVRALSTVIPSLPDALLFHEVDASPTFVSNGQFPGRVGRERLPVATPLGGLYLCGDGAGGRGVACELEASSAMQVLDALTT